jgi:hypothetical protein
VGGSEVNEPRKEVVRPSETDRTALYELASDYSFTPVES